MNRNWRSRQYRTAFGTPGSDTEARTAGENSAVGHPDGEGPNGTDGGEVGDRAIIRGRFSALLIRIPPEEDSTNGAERDRAKRHDGYSLVVDVDLKSYFDTISHELLLGLVERRVGDVQVLRLIRAWLKAGVMEEGKVTHPDRGSPPGLGDFAAAAQHLSARGRSSMVPERRRRSRPCSAGPLCGRYGVAGANGARGAGGMGSTPESVRRSSLGGESREESTDDFGRGFRVSRLRIP